MTWLRQVHGADVVVVATPGEHTGVDADAAVTTTPGCRLAVRTADCAPIVLRGRSSVGIVHAGWKGLLAGVVDRAVDAMGALDGAPVDAVLGPCIRPGCYEFKGPELDALVERFGAEVRSSTSWGTPSLDLPGAVRASLASHGISVTDVSGCTACDRRWYSHRARAETERFATFAWLEEGT